MAYSVEKADADLRGYLHARLADFVQGYVNAALADGDIALAEYTQRSYQPRLDALLEGREVKYVCRDDMPDWHPEAMCNTSGGRPDDRFVLGPDDVLRPEESKAPAFVPPNRAERRAAGWRGPWTNGNGVNGGPTNGSD